MEDESPVAPETQAGQETAPVAETPVAEQTPQEQKLSDAWNEVMGIIPSQLHSQVTPHFRQWDANFTRKMQEVHSQYAPFKPFLEQNVEPDQINNALQVLQAIENDPMRVINALTEHAKQAGMWPEEKETESSEQDPEDIDDAVLKHPKFLELQNVVNLMAQEFMQQKEQASASQQEKELETEIAALTQKYGEFDPEWVLTKAIAALNAGEKVSNLEPFVQQYKQFTENLIAKSRTPAPKVLGGAGQADTGNQWDPKAASDKDRRAMVAQMLSATAQQGQ